MGSKRVWFPYGKLEEHSHGMWRQVPVEEREGYIEAARALMADPSAFREAMVRVVEEWPHSMTAAMSTPSLNRRAFMGHAGCCLVTGSPEDLTRLGWHRLTPEQQDAANAAADEAIAAYEAGSATWRETWAEVNGFWEDVSA